jgi:hypothetical protein
MRIDSSIFKRRVAFIPALYPLWQVLVVFYVLWKVHFFSQQTETVQLFMLPFSFALDCLAVVLLRRVMSYLTDSSSAPRVTWAIFSLTFFAVAILGLPLYFIVHAPKGAPDIEVRLVVSLMEMTGLSLSTALLCLLPAFLLFVLLIHRIFWPAVSRVVYPLARYQIVTQRKVLFPLAIICISYGLGITSLFAPMLGKALP